LSNEKEKIMRCLYVSVICLLLPVLGFSATIHVPADQPTIQAGIDAAVNGDTVLVAPGTYVENIDFLGKAITVKSKWGPKVTIIDGGNPSNPDYGSCVYFGNGEGPDSALKRFTLTNGTGSDPDGDSYFAGGGVCCDSASPTIADCIITGNAADVSGGIYCGDSSPTITNNIVSENTAVYGGGGIDCFDSSPTITNNTICGNMASNKGGGIYCRNNSSPNLSNNILWNNDASEGPEIWIGGQYSPSTLTISYSDVEGGQASVYLQPGSTLNWGPGMIDSDPLFVDTDNFHLIWDSPCKDAGDNTAPEVPNVDFEGDPRIAYGDVDMGADEFHRHLYYSGDAWPDGDIELKFVDTPWTQIQGLILGIDIYDPPIPGAYGDWYIKQPMALILGLGFIQPTGFFVLAGTIPDTFPSDITLYLQAMIGMKLTNLCAMYVQEPSPLPPPGMVEIPAGEFDMGDHHDGMSNALPVHTVYISSFYMDIYEVINEQYCGYLNSAYSQDLIEVSSGVVYKKNDSEPYCDTTTSSSYSRIHWDGGTETFSVTPGKEDHPMVRVSWYGAVAYANWRSAQKGLPSCYDLESWECSFGAGGYRLSTEAEWEYASRGGEHNPYYRYPWGDSLDGSKANYLNSGDPYETGPNPWTTPVGYYDGNQIPVGSDMANGYGLYDMAGNVWEWCNDWYSSSYYSSSPYNNPKGPSSSTYRVTRGGSWLDDSGDLRCADRVSLGPGSRNYDGGFRLVLEMP